MRPSSILAFAHVNEAHETAGRPGAFTEARYGALAENRERSLGPVTRGCSKG